MNSIIYEEQANANNWKQCKTIIREDVKQPKKRCQERQARAENMT